MMHVIDLEIMIPASPDFIWRFLGDIATAAEWQDGVIAVSFLTTQHEGKGARWRYSQAKGSDIIFEAAAWYDTLGYEYTIVDGAGFGNNQGRIRLQEVTNGTLVRWTFNYESGGMLGGLRNAMRLKRNTTRQIQESLRNLHNLVQKDTGGISTHSARPTVREAPDADERSIYQPRYPTTFNDPASEANGDEAVPEDLQPVAYALDEDADPAPGQTDGDTKPNPVVLGGDGLLDMESQKNEIEAATEPIDAEIVNIEPDDLKEVIEAPDRSANEPVEAISINRPVPARAQRDSVDTSTLSVFEIFGLQKPSETRDLQPSPGDSLAEPTSMERDNEVLLERRRDLSFFYDEEDDPPRDPLDYLDSSPIAKTAASSESVQTKSAQLTGMRRLTRRSSCPLRTHN